MKAFKETEKAVMLDMVLEFYNIEKSLTRKVWFPKSQIHEGSLSDWIVEKKKEEIRMCFPVGMGGCFAYVYDADGNEVK